MCREILEARWPVWLGRPIVHDPFAGTGERLRDFALNSVWLYSGTEIEPAFINEMVSAVEVGDSRDASTYPPALHPAEVAMGGWVVMTSPVYANGMADNHVARDESRRRNYRKFKAEVTGDPEVALEEGNMANFGYRGTKRPEDGGKSTKRVEYWSIARDCVQHWSSASLILVNVSDFKHSRGVVEPHVDDWCALLREFGWNLTLHPVGTRRMRDGENREERVDHEVVIVGEH